MHVFVTGGSGQTGPAIVRELIRGGHAVTGLARSDASAARLEGLGASVVCGSLEDLDVLAAAAAASDGVVHMAYGGGDYSDPESMSRRETGAIDAFGRALEGSGKPLVVTSGTLVLPFGREGTERDSPNRDGAAAARIVGEDACLALVDRGVRAIVLRLAPTVHGPRDHGFIPMFITTAKQTGASSYVGDGMNRWPAVHRDDAAVLYRLAIEEAPAASVLHAVAENVRFKDIAETVGRGLGLPVDSITPEQAEGHYVNPFLGLLYGSDAPSSSALTRELVGWTPTRIGLLEDIADGDYLT